MGRTCIIGAGSSGVTVAKALKEAGQAFDIFEIGSQIGGMWRYGNDNGRSSCYASLHIDTSRPNLGYSDFPIDPKLPDFLSHRQFLEHLEAYAAAHGIPEKVTFNTRVESVVPEEGGYRVTLGSGEVRDYDRVVIATGHLTDTRQPDFPGTFNGESLHSHHYRTADPFIGKRVLVVGIGNSAVDIAVDLCRRAEHVTLSTRRSAWVMPKYLMGVPIDQWSGFLGRRLRLPSPMVRRIMAQLIKLGVGDQRRFGLPRPEHPMYREHATLSQELLPMIGHGYIDVKPNVAELRGDGVAFVDGSEAEYDAVIYATGYEVTFPFLDRWVFDPDLQLGELYRRMVVPAHPGLIHAGLVQPVGPTIPLVEVQGKWIAALASGAMTLPSREGMDAEIRAHRDYQRRVYVDSPRYVLEVDGKLYSGQMKADMASGVAG
ncbi:monooxygenase [Primorskyibacter flagellatus]|uniref:4-hydroxybenzoate brominase (decarboxylating) n=1 Tax=Primorskyibacter flagellatus TaxID=1387277 RepID=A0A917EGH2_9RHOB|nr:NAD(P)-binding domain-containing protein [Primorskyibacter flagellatus]GGE32839.1 monooxygenase [Primorskyibacter flagellatus]